uniref:Acetyl-CoA carboxylase central domain-containing protein n=1 Tax=Aegilops tauschii subsp. strangulata TaxID=200361 RepID=A0A453JMB5_AEGTS
MAVFVQASGLIARWDLVGPSSGRSAEPFHGTFPKLEPPTAISGKVHQKFAASANSAHMILAGYERSINHVRNTILSLYSYSSTFVSLCLSRCHFPRLQSETNILICGKLCYLSSINRFLAVPSLSGCTRFAKLPRQP